MNIFLDDYRHPLDVRWVRLPDVEWVIVKSYQEFCDLLSSYSGELGHVSLDHDLKEDHYFGNYDGETGLECLEYLLEWVKSNDKTLPHLTVHTLNETRGNIMRQKIIDHVNNKFSSDQ